MTQRNDYMKEAPELFKGLSDQSMRIKKGSIAPKTLALVDIRASQINGCSFCLDMHVKQAKLLGERELRLHHVAAWRESPLFDAKERAALDWTEALTTLPVEGVSNQAYARASEHFSAKELAELTHAVALINAWNRLSIAFRPVPGAVDKAYGLDKAGLE
ncbi:carboxymuconolactone decarboxylase family protein [soil metagenome]